MIDVQGKIEGLSHIANIIQKEDQGKIEDPVLIDAATRGGYCSKRLVGSLIWPCLLYFSLHLLIYHRES